MAEIPSELGVQIWQVVVDLLVLPDVEVSFAPFPATTLDGEEGWEQQIASNREAFPDHHPEDVVSHGHSVFRQPVFFKEEPRTLG